MFFFQQGVLRLITNIDRYIQSELINVYCLFQIASRTGGGHDEAVLK